MARYIARRAFHAVVLIFVTITVTFFVVHIAPGDPALRYVGPGTDEAAIERVRQNLGLDASLIEQYARWLWSFARGDFGESLVSGRPVSEVLARTIPRTLQLTLLAFIVQLLVGGAVGMFAAARRGGKGDQLASLTALLLYAIPTFYLAYLLISVFALRLGWLPTSGIATPGGVADGAWTLILDRVQHLVLPTAVLGLGSAAALARYTRGSMIDSLATDPIRTARAKGLSEAHVLWRHALRDALPPLLTIIGLSVPFLLGGAVVVEKVFAWPGMGSLAVDAIFERDYPVVVAVTFVASVIVVLGNFLADVATMFADPRTKIATDTAIHDGAGG